MAKNADRKKRRADVRHDPIHGTKLMRNPRVPHKYKRDKTKNVWRLICEDLQQRGRLYSVLVHILEMYCDSYDMYLEACEILREDGMTVHEDKTGATRKHPMLIARKDCFEQMNSLEKKLGLTPYYRDRIEPDDFTNKEEKHDPMADLMN